MPFCTVTEQALLGYELGNTAPAIPTTHYCGLISAASRTNGMTLTLGAYIINPTSFPFSATSSVWSIFKVTTGGTAAGSPPAGYATGGSAGGTITDGTAVVTEVSTLFAAGTFTAVEPSGNGYAEQPITNTTTNWPAPSGGDPTQVQNGVAVTFPQTTGSWGQIAGFLLRATTITTGTPRLWGLLATASLVATNAGVAPTFAIDALTAQLT